MYLRIVTAFTCEVEFPDTPCLRSTATCSLRLVFHVKVIILLGLCTLLFQICRDNPTAVCLQYLCYVHRSASNVSLWGHTWGCLMLQNVLAKISTIPCDGATFVEIVWLIPLSILAKGKLHFSSSTKTVNNSRNVLKNISCMMFQNI